MNKNLKKGKVWEWGELVSLPRQREEGEGGESRGSRI